MEEELDHAVRTEYPDYAYPGGWGRPSGAARFRFDDPAAIRCNGPCPELPTEADGDGAALTFFGLTFRRAPR